MDPLKEIKVLYVEDDKAHANTIIMMLKKCQRIKFEVTYRGDLQSSIEYLNSTDCNLDVILLDLMLPNSEGVDTFKKVYEVCKIPIVIISSFENIAYDCISLGAQDYLVKPDISIRLVSRSLEYAIERFRNNQKMKESKDRYKELVEATGASIYEIDFKTMRFIYVNDVMSKLTGWSREELLEIGPADFLTEKGIREFSGRIEALHRGEYISETHEYQIIVKDGSIKWAVITAAFREDEEGNITGASVVAIDITDRKIAEEQARQKEEIIFAELENKIHEWKEEIAEASIKQANEIRVINKNIESITNGVVR